MGPIISVFWLLLLSASYSQRAVGEAALSDASPRKFRFYWNVPSFQCESKGIPFENLAKFGIIQNEGDRYRGDKIALLYDEHIGYFPALLFNQSDGVNNYTIRNGGVPQEGDLDVHLKFFETQLSLIIPDANFDGIGVIDFESWQPIFRQHWNAQMQYQSLSKQLEWKRYRYLPSKMVNERVSLMAKQRFEEAARMFMEYTLAVAKNKRPLARWGYYGFPYCYNKNNIEDCPKEVLRENDQIKWLWTNSTALYPSVYSYRDMDISTLIKHVRGRVKEAARVRSNNAYILPFFTYRYQNSNGRYFNKDELIAILDTIAASEANGLLIWGSSMDMDTEYKCEEFRDYIYNVFGPLVAKYATYDDLNFNPIIY